MASLWEIKNELYSCFNDVVDPETGEVIGTEVDEQRLKQLEWAYEDKVESIALWYKNLESDAEMYKKAKMEFAKKQEMAQKKMQYLAELLDRELDGKMFEPDDKLVKISYRKSEKVEVNLDELLKSENGGKFVRFSAPEPNKADIKKYLKLGNTLAGCELVVKNNIQIK